MLPLRHSRWTFNEAIEALKLAQLSLAVLTARALLRHHLMTVRPNTHLRNGSPIAARFARNPPAHGFKNVE